MIGWEIGIMKIWGNCHFVNDGLSMPSHMNTIVLKLNLDGKEYLEEVVLIVIGMLG
jgi:hypothetical protein